MRREGSGRFDQNGGSKSVRIVWEQPLRSDDSYASICVLDCTFMDDNVGREEAGMVDRWRTPRKLNALILDDALRAPHLFCWFGAIPFPELDEWAQRTQSSRKH